MKRILDSKEMKQADQTTSARFHISSEILMERAALSAAELITERFCTDTLKVCVIAGCGNNGGDGIACARILKERGVDVSICLIDADKANDAVSNQLKAAKAYDIPILSDYRFASDATVVVDAIFGTGLSRPIDGQIRDIIEEINTWSVKRIAIDIPSGISADTGEILGCAFNADITVTFAYMKRGQLLFPGRGFCGELVLYDIGITDKSLPETKANVYCIEKTDIAAMLPARISGSHKGTYGKVLIVAGSPGMAGAACLAAEAALRVGCGMVRVLTHEDNRTVLQEKIPEAIISTYGKAPSERELMDALHWADSLVIGPGLGTSDTAAKILNNLLENASIPVVLDADALNILSNDQDMFPNFHGDMILTPHLKEFARLKGESVSYIKSHLVELSLEFAYDRQAVVIAKDAATVTAIPYGSAYINRFGDNGMSTAGSGDVLSGILGGLLASGLSAETAGPLGVSLHALCGEAAAKRLGSRSMIARDLVSSLSCVLKEITPL